MSVVNNFVHIIIYVDDLKAAREFFSNVFTWKITPIQKGSNEIYFNIKEEGDFMSGTICEVSHTSDETSIFLYIHVEDLEEIGKKVEKHGGKVVEPPFELDQFSGRMMNIKDPSGNLFGLWSEN